MQIYIQKNFHCYLLWDFKRGVECRDQSESAGDESEPIEKFRAFPTALCAFSVLVELTRPLIGELGKVVLLGGESFMLWILVDGSGVFKYGSIFLLFVSLSTEDILPPTSSFRLVYFEQMTGSFDVFFYVYSLLQSEYQSCTFLLNERFFFFALLLFCPCVKSLK